MDTDHISVLKFQGSERQAWLVARLQAVAPEIIGTTIVTVEEQMRGWLGALSREKLTTRQVIAYRELAELFDFFRGFFIALFDDTSADRFEKMRHAGSRVPSMDLKIASIALANDALLLTSNRRDFEKVPDLRFENWMD